MRAGRSYRLADIAEQIGALGLKGSPADTDLEISGLASLASAAADQLSFVSDARFLPLAQHSGAGALICSPALAEQLEGPCILHSEPYLAYARASSLFRDDGASGDIHPSAEIHPDAILGRNLSIGPRVVVGAGSRIGDDCILGAGSVIGEDCVLGERTRLHANVTLYAGVSLGTDCIVHSGAVIGADGFGFAPSSEGWVKIHQLGGVRIGNRVEIGANSCIDRGALDDTLIGDGVKIDDLVMIAHNVSIGDHSALAGQVGIAGSTRIGRHCTLAGNVGLVGHIQLTDNVHVTGKTMITSSIDVPGSYSSGTHFSDTRRWRRNAARFNQLDQLVQRLQKLEKKQN